MPDVHDMGSWPERIRRRYESYLKTSFFFKDPGLRASFQTALQEEESLLKGPYREQTRGFRTQLKAQALARECFPEAATDLLPALIVPPLYVHQSGPSAPSIRSSATLWSRPAPPAGRPRVFCTRSCSSCIVSISTANWANLGFEP